ncbi:sigma factor-like helix-turn-helix DNA-binding protein [Anaerotruncus massiliensis (ex Togo et al. 2019)]|jgi:hypothetical protein|uniref:RNA polymerase sigma-70 region 4 domain-containing protein n=1 Tax=Phage sp. ctR9T2 TaxID=2825795 RepID=A0A8S5UFK9_9VIRU|nr:sigma factor-like helix-turn-helix DNA-binding protein [Anaerotruncus massiliensis (ex Togo et al. 2019)]GKH46030.1 hypothetical protein CE91St45_05920 [Oscillospiraceae bacterium]DAF93279.1 MAG TPA: Protein of unknown function (DUF722) [Phage sp. ctR9T2]
MTNQEKKAYLGRYRDNEREIRRTEEEILRWESLSRKTTTTMGAAGGGSNGEDKLQAAVEKIVRWQNRLTLQLAERVRLREEIEAAIGTVEDERLRLLLRYRYIDGLTFERIAVELNYSWRQICNLHGKALNEVKTS